MTLKIRATIEDLYREPGKAELVNGKIVRMSPTGEWPGYAGDEIYASLREYARRTKSGRAFADNKAFIINLPHRESVSPDAAYHIGASSKMKFITGAPRFAAEVRSEEDYGPAAETAMADKRRDYFAAGTLVVWDVDFLSEDVVRVFRVRTAKPEDLPSRRAGRGRARRPRMDDAGR